MHYISLLYLLLSSYSDIKNRKISIVLSLLFIIMAFFIMGFLYGFTLGLLFFLFSIISKGKLGMGDALLIFTTGFYFSFFEMFTIIFYSLFLSSIFSIYKIYSLKLKKSDLKRFSLPFAPFLFLGLLIYYFINYILGVIL